MSQQRQVGGVVSELVRPVSPARPDRSEPARAPRRAARVAALSLGVLVLGALGMGTMYINSPRTTEGIERLSAAWAQLRSATRLSLTWFTTTDPDARPQRIIAELQPRLSAGRASPAISAPLGQSAIAYGDRLKIMFFENIAVSLGDSSAAPAAPAPVTIFPRMDLSGEYVVDEAGGLDLPRLGWRAVAGQGVGTLETQLAEAFRHAFHRPGDVHVALLDRRPIYVLGGPRGGTTIKHAPGMIVLQALAEAGGYHRDASDVSQTIEAIRETQRLGETQDRLARALVRQARLSAMRDGHAAVKLPIATAALLAATLPQAIAELLQEADATLALEERAHADQLALASRQVNIANLELAAQGLRAVQSQTMAESKTARLRGIEWIAARGSVSQTRRMDAIVDVAEAVAKQEDLRAAVAQAQSRLLEAEVARGKLVQTYTSQVTLDLASATQEVGDLRRAVAAMQAVVAVLGEGQDAPLGIGSGSPGLSIVRREPGGTFLIPAFDATPLLPGDVLQIGSSKGMARPDIGQAHVQRPNLSEDAAQPAAPDAQF